VNRPSAAQAYGLAATLVGAAAIAGVVGQIELSNQLHSRIWSNAWVLVAMVLGGVAVVVATAYFLASIFARERRSAEQGQQEQHAFKPDQEPQIALAGENDQAADEAALAHPPRSDTLSDAPLHVEQILDGLRLGEHDEAERRVNRLFLHLTRDQQQAVVGQIIRVATTTEDDTVKLTACSLLEAADRLDPMLVKIEDVEALARSADFSLRSSAAVLMWQWAGSAPGRVPIALLGKLAQPSTEDWYVHAAARAGAKQLLLRRAAARAIYDRMAASRDRTDREYAAGDLLELARTEPRAVPADLAAKLANDPERSVAAQGVELVQVIGGVDENERQTYYSSFGSDAQRQLHRLAAPRRRSGRLDVSQLPRDPSRAVPPYRSLASGSPEAARQLGQARLGEVHL
jgi:hypothetical protein